MVISKFNNLVTIINVFTVEAADQQVLLDLILSAAGGLMKNIPGFLSAGLHKSLSANRIILYLQWKNMREYQAMLEDANYKSFMEKAHMIAICEPAIYQVVETY